LSFSPHCEAIKQKERLGFPRKLSLMPTSKSCDYRVLIVSDLHLDDWLDAGRDPLSAMGLAHDTLSQLDGLIIAGDLCDDARRNAPLILGWLGRHMDVSRIHFLPGNHDYFQDRIDHEDRLKQVVLRAGAQWAQKADIRFGAVRFLCCTLWTDFALFGNAIDGMDEVRNWMPDYTEILAKDPDFGDRWFQPEDALALHQDHRDWLEGRLAEAFAGDTVVVTHHVPHPAIMTWQSLRNVAFGSDLTPLIDRWAPGAWFCGHCHSGLSAVVGKTRIIEVSLGYPSEVPLGWVNNLAKRGLVRCPVPIAGDGLR